MLSLSQFRRHMFNLITLMERTATRIEVVHNGVVYEMYLEKTNKKPILHRPKRSTKGKQVLQQLDISLCNTCGNVSVNGVCMDKNCHSESFSSDKLTA